MCLAHAFAEERVNAPPCTARVCEVRALDDVERLIELLEPREDAVQTPPCEREFLNTAVAAQDLHVWRTEDGSGVKTAHHHVCNLASSDARHHRSGLGPFDAAILRRVPDSYF